MTEPVHRVLITEYRMRAPAVHDRASGARRKRSIAPAALATTSASVGK
jgi:hypothetical protein